VIIMVVYFIMGIPMSGLTIVLLTMPILLPVLNAFHINLLWFGVLTIAQCELATLLASGRQHALCHRQM